MKESKKTIYISDTPNIEKDSFQIHTNIAKTLFDIIENYDISTKAFTIGLFGAWGSGKSYIINKLLEQIKKESKNFTLINIDVWKYSGYPLLRSILFNIDNTLKSLYEKNNEKYKNFKDGYKNSDRKSLKDILYCDEVLESETKFTIKGYINTIKKFLNFCIIPTIILVLFIVVPMLPIDWEGIDCLKKIYPILKPIYAPIVTISSIFACTAFYLKILEPLQKNIGDLIFLRNTIKHFTEKANFSPEQFEKIFKDMLLQLQNGKKKTEEKEKFIIVFDNLDRCPPNIAYETLSTIKTFMDIENCFYIIPIDDEAIKKYLSNLYLKENDFEGEFAKEFIDKIFQTYIRIPYLKEVERDVYIEELLEKIDFQNKITPPDIETIKEILYFAYKGESPRNIIRFINDYSTYFQLAQKTYPDLLKNITLFTIMISIKQKWHLFEKQLLLNPTFFKDYEKKQEELNDGLDIFLDNISGFYIPQIKNENISSYIYLKKSEKIFEIAECLKTKQYEKIELNQEVIKIILKEFKNNIKKEGAFSLNSFITLAYLIIRNKELILMKTFWISLFNVDLSQVKSIFKELLSENILDNIINTLNSDKIKELNDEIKKFFTKFFEEPISKKVKSEEEEKTFEAILKSYAGFMPDDTKKIFENWKKDNEYLNSLLYIIRQNNKNEYLPRNVIEWLVENNIDAKSLELLQNWNNENIPQDLGEKLFSNLFSRLNNKDLEHPQQIQPQIPFIKEDYTLLSLIDISFVKTENKNSFLRRIIYITPKLFQFDLALAINFWFEIVHFADFDNKFADTSLTDIYNKYIKTGKPITFKEAIRYPKKLLNLNLTKQTLFTTKPELQIAIYKKLDDKYFSDFDLLLSYPIEIVHIDNLDSILKEKYGKDVAIDKLSEYLLEKVIKEFIENKIDISNKLNHLNKKYDLNAHRKIIIENKNKILDYYKENPSIGINILKAIKPILTYNELYDNIIKSILNFIKSQLEAAEAVNNFKNIAELIDIIPKESTKLVYSIAQKCLEKNQEADENFLGIKIIEKIFNNLDNKQKNEITDLIKKNDNFSKWPEDVKESLRKWQI